MCERLVGFSEGPQRSVFRPPQLSRQRRWSLSPSRGSPTLGCATNDARFLPPFPPSTPLKASFLKRRDESCQARRVISPIFLVEDENPRLTYSSLPSPGHSRLPCPLLPSVSLVKSAASALSSSSPCTQHTLAAPPSLSFSSPSPIGAHQFHRCGLGPSLRTPSVGGNRLEEGRGGGFLVGEGVQRLTPMIERLFNSLALK